MPFRLFIIADEAAMFLSGSLPVGGNAIKEGLGFK